MAYTSTQLQALQNALASGVTRVTFEGRSVEYSSIDNLRKAIEVVQTGLNQQNGIVPSRQVRIVAHKGIGHHGTMWPGGFYEVD